MKFIFAYFLLCFVSFGARCTEYFDEVYQRLETDFEGAIAMVDSIEADVNTKSLKEQVDFHDQAARFFATIGDFEKEVAHLSKQIEQSPESRDSIYHIHQKLGVAYMNSGNFEAALSSFKVCADYFSRHVDFTRLARTYNGIAAVLGHQNKSDSAIVYFTTAIKIYEQLNSRIELSYTYSNLAVLYVEMGEIQKALDLRQKAYNIVVEEESEVDIHYCEVDLGSSYNAAGDYEKAILILQSARAFFESNFNAQILNAVYNELGRSYSEIGDHEMAEIYYLKSIDLLKSGGFDFALPGTLGNYGIALNKAGHYNKAVDVCNSAMKIAKEIGYLDVEMVLCECLYSGYKGNNQTDSALFFFENLQLLIDSLSNVDLQKSVLKQELETNHGFEKQSLLVNANNEINEEIYLRQFWIAGATILLLTLIILFFAFRQKKKSEEAIKVEKQYLDNLLHNLVHEFRTPLTLIKGPTEELLKKDTHNSLLKLVDKNSDHMLMLVNQVLDFAKIKAGRLAVVEETMNLTVFFHDIRVLFEPLAKEKQIQLLNQVDVFDSLVKIDTDKLFKIVSNLISNAIKYSDEKAIVTLHAQVSSKTLIVTIQDTGIGISEENQAHVFKKFYQVDATITRKAEGTGLGLAFVKELITLMQGEILLESKVGVGTKVTVSLPIQVLDQAAPSLGKKAEYNIESEDVLSTIPQLIPADEDKKMILVIEDNRDLQSFLRQLLEDQGYDVHSAGDGLEGVEKAEELIPDLVISDVMMPKMDGLQVVQKLKSTFATDHIPIIMLTAKVSFDSMVDGLSVGADDYLSKPFKSQELMLRVTNLLQRQEKLRAKYQEQVQDEPLKISVKDPLIQKIEALILSDLSVQTTVEDLAQACALSRSQLHRKIKFITGLSTTALLTEIRLTQSKIDLKTTQLSISEIAYKFGYSDPAHYSKLFKKQFDITPSDYRNSAR